MAYLFDSNNFLRLAEPNKPERQLVLNAIRKLRTNNEIICYTPQVLSEFWNVCTRPQTVSLLMLIYVKPMQIKFL